MSSKTVIREGLELLLRKIGKEIVIVKSVFKEWPISLV